MWHGPIAHAWDDGAGAAKDGGRASSWQVAWAAHVSADGSRELICFRSRRISCSKPQGLAWLGLATRAVSIRSTLLCCMG
jgi:hypothetical protein